MLRAIINATALGSMLVIGLVTCGKVHARDGVRAETHCTSSRFYGRSCSTTVTPVYRQELTAEDVAAREARIAKWDAYCQPRRVQDSEGIVRLVYAKAGCEFGVAEDLPQAKGH